MKNVKPNTATSRQDDLVRAAFDRIVEVGLEGLRTRDVADRVGINIATLHYHFPTKRELIEGVVHFVARAFQDQHAVSQAIETDRPVSGLEMLHQEFADARKNFEKRPDLMTVLGELILLARRDAEIAEMVAPLFSAWRGGVVEFLAQGVRDGSFRSDLNPQDGANLLTSAVWGAYGLLADRSAFERMCAEIEKYLVDDATSKP